MAKKIPVILLKTKSVPVDKYQEYFESLGNGSYDPKFIPVLQHQMLESALSQISNLISSHSFLSSDSRKYGGIIFTSQRAVEAFEHVVKGLEQSNELFDRKAIFYVVGPATSRAVRSIGLSCPILGEETGNGEALAEFILKDYNSRWSEAVEKPALLFLVGEQRRDIIPKTLQADTLAEREKIIVDELEVYKTAEHPDFEEQFRHKWAEHEQDDQWVVVFSPSGCRTMLQVLGVLNDEGNFDQTKHMTTKVATIGPTTKAFLGKEFHFEPQVCSPNPTPESLGDAIHLYHSKILS